MGEKLMDTERTCLLIIDIQYDFLDASSPLFVRGGPSIISNIEKILNYFRENNQLVIFVKRLHRSDGSDVDKTRIELFQRTGGFLIGGTRGAEIVEAIKPLPSEAVVIKKRWSAFFHTELDLMLRREKIKDLIICGIQTPNCIRATFTDAISLDYDVIVLEDGTASSNLEIQKSNLLDMENIGAKILRTDEVINLLKYQI
ncbi:MAG: cysteine hydrolase [Caldiserica bacterium CG02_land_8_20_14_3_00_36_38]|jgi:nicotinamidase-related amidase|nr:MAG: isochorismatase [Caldiserica bacterium CG23_combo_of_CG06-09_8_20_14_all_35_60]PIV55569.1 MAG: cysteine hydrolase [Caldiserica bacterium CG02_land_8_20_14_3_00_36_38]